MVVQNCGWCKGPEADVTDLSCLCKKGYMNKEGTFIHGSWVSSGRALSKDHYEQHQDCQTCNHNARPQDCKWRQDHLASPATQQETCEEDDYVHFFVPSKRIDPKVLKAFLDENGGKKAESEGGKFFKSEEGFAVTARFRFNSRDLLQLQELSERRRQGQSTKKEFFIRRSRSAHRRLNEFTHFLQETTGEEPAIRASPQQRSNPAQSDRHRPERTVPETTLFQSHYTNDRRERQDSVSELTLPASRVSISDRHRRDTVLVQAEMGQRQGRQSDRPGSPQYGTVQPARTHADSTRHDAVYRERHSASEYKQNDGRSTYVSSNSALFEQQASGRPAREVSDDEDADVIGHRTAHPSTVVREPVYHDRHSIPSNQQRERRNSYLSPVTSRQQAVQRPIREESDSEDSTGVDPKRKQTKSDRIGPPRSDRHSKPSGKQPREPEKASKPAPKTQARRKSSKQASASDTDSEEATDIPRIKFFIPSEGLDLTVLAFYVRLCVDSSATVKPTNHKGKDGFLLEAKRAVTVDELSDMKRDTKEWLSEKRGLSSRDSYVGSETAKQRRKRAARKT